MGKIPSSFRSSRLPVSTMLRNPKSVPPEQHQSSTPTPTPTPTPPRTRHFPKKSTFNKRPPKHPTLTQSPRFTFDSPNLSDAKTLFNSLVTSFAASAAQDLNFLNSILQSFAAISTLSDSISLFRHMIKTHPPFSPDRSTYHILLSQSCKSPDSSLSPVHQVLNLMLTDGFPPDKVTTDIAARTLCSVGREEDAVELIKELSCKHSPPDTYTYNFLVKHLVKSRTLITVNNFIKEMRESFEIKPDLVTYTIMIDNVCNTKNLREAIRLLGVLAEEGFKPDRYVYNTIMKGYCKLNRGAEVLSVYKKMEEEGIEPDIVTYNTLIFGLSKAGRVKEARKYLNVMAEMGHFPDAVTYTSLMNGIFREKNVNASEALQLLEEMEAKGCSPNSCTYNTVLHGLCKLKLLEKGIEFYGVMKAGDMKLETGSYGTFVRALIRNGRIAEAYEVFDYAVESKSMTDFAAYSTLESTLRWLKKAKEQGFVV
ncbi:pentatricopeptide repeat-containing protein At2g17670 [Cornus florida]|uniref:pentatricopeptide repeat-containing protein At2g17670 n=1 Tax=Cornus florida TaxID=4283 RepID=UPI002897E2F3|nr:pentatricopeptide repeat-containing protein At2g17670 [Cornus florida]